MSKVYASKSVAQVQATKQGKKQGVTLVAHQVDGGWQVGPEREPGTALAPTGWQVIEADDAAPLNDTLREVPSRKTVTLSLPLTTVSSTYLGALHDGREVWFDKKSLESFEVEAEAKMLTVTMARSKAVRRRLVQPAA